MKKSKIYLIPTLGYIVIIFISSIVLSMKITNNGSTTYSNSLFTAISAVSCTGLSTVVIANQYNILGQIIIAILMEIGAMGFLIFVAYYWIKLKRKIKISDALLLNETLQNDNLMDLKEYEMFIVKMMTVFQGIGALLLSFKFVPKFGVKEGLWKSIFHSISAFANAGFDIMGSNSLIEYSNDIYIQIVFIVLMILGSIGIFVIRDLKLKKYKLEKLKLQSKIILVYTTFFLIIPVIIFKINNINMSILNALFMSATSRSTGFTICNVIDLPIITKYVLMILMFVGGSPASTAGGIRIVSIAVIFSTIVATLKGKTTIIFWKKISDELVKKAFVIFTLFIIFLLIGVMIINYYDQEVLSFNILFESISAITNTGLSVFDYNNISLQSKIILMILMFIGRIGALTLLLLFVNNDDKNMIEYPEEKIII